MATTFTIPLTTLPVEARDLGPSHPADSETGFTLTIDRTVAGGLNSLTSATAILVSVSQSNDAGATWQEIGEVTVPGGTTINPKTGLTATVSLMTTYLLPGTSRQLKATVTVTGTPVAVAGTLTSQ